MANVSTNLNKQRQAVQCIKDVFSTAEIMGLSHGAMLDRLASVDALVEKCPQWVKSYIHGYRDCLFDGLYSHKKLIFGMVVDGKFYSTHKDRADYYEKHGLSPCDFNYQMNENRHAVGHYWADSLKPFSISSN